ncbi:MAG: methyltransferase domain-containing protein [Spirochaetes bacterium]|nr:methyltransferase domain-containing protein [Spirochaetota bacterium]
MAERIDFDDYSERYDELMKKRLGFFERDEGYFARYKIELVRRLLRTQPQRILEYGCGVGRNVGHLVRIFPDAEVYGCDISQKSTDVARKKNPEASFFIAKEKPPVPSFDLVIVANVLHHVPKTERRTVVGGLMRLLGEGGRIFLFEHNPYNPLTRRIVNTCPFDKDAVLLAPGESKRLLKEAGASVTRSGYCLFFPGFMSGIRVFERVLFWLPLGGQYYIEANMPPGRFSA